uniref:WRKY domain-containing protein n=2 Tax=Aegilops tauschii subsp. strangulata TaxID=200361 RepID=A0A453FTT0_AEGTS|nr:WRKY transcription factor SUSIBA2-like [Aegilops tauschii subsp. strangulata]
MAFQQEAVGKLWEELGHGYNLSAKLLALLSQPGHLLDSHGQEMAVAISQELSQVFRASLSMLNPGNSGRVVEGRATAPEAAIMEGSISQATPAIISGEEVTPPRIGKEEEITAEPYKDGYKWKKYGQKNIKNRKFARLYFRCMHSHERGCRAKKQVQQQDNSIGNPPLYKVTCLNEHTCHQAFPNVNITNANLAATSTTTRNGADYDPARGHLHVGGNGELEDRIMTSTFSTVIGGAALAAPSLSPVPSPPPVEASPSGPASYDTGGGQSPSLLDLSMCLDETMMDEMYFSCGSPFPPVEANAAPWSLSSLPPPPPPMEASSIDPAAYMPPRCGHSLSLDAMTMAEIFLWSSPLFSPR